MSFVTAAMIAGGATLASSLIGSRAASKAADVQAQAAEQGTAAQERMFNRQVELQEPWRQAGMNALNRMQSGDVMGMMDPSYKFRLGEGMKALERSAAARGGLISGGALKAAQRYGQDVASTEFGNAYNRLAGLAGVGQTATGAMSSAAGQFGQNQSAGLANAAQARASGYVGGANALTGGLNQYLNYTQSQNMLGMLQNRGGAGGYGTGGVNADLVMNPYFGTMGGNQ
jgi:hypothetical protein